MLLVIHKMKYNHMVALRQEFFIATAVQSFISQLFPILLSS